MKYKYLDVYVDLNEVIAISDCLVDYVEFFLKNGLNVKVFAKTGTYDFAKSELDKLIKIWKKI